VKSSWGGSSASANLGLTLGFRKVINQSCVSERENRSETLLLTLCSEYRSIHLASLPVHHLFTPFTRVQPWDRLKRKRLLAPSRKLPDLRENGPRYARWKSKNGGKVKTVRITVARVVDRIDAESSTYYAKYPDAQGVVREVPTGCKDKQFAERVLSNPEREPEVTRSVVPV
jgi:hypothetical protein